MPRIRTRHAALCLALAATLAPAQNATDPLKSGFENPPEGARPRVWWHWMNGNITQEGIKLDLEWMHRAGLGGFQNFDAALFTPQVVEKRLAYMTPDWKDAFKYATTVADQLGLEEAIAGSPGWSETGGPWVPAKEAMKKYVWSETRIEGGKPFTGTLAHPPSNTGAFQNLPIEDLGNMLGEAFERAAVLCRFRSHRLQGSCDRCAASSLSSRRSPTSGGTIDPALLSDGDLVKTVALPMAKEMGGKAWIQYEFAQPQTIRALTIVAGKKSPDGCLSSARRRERRALEASDDGQNYHVVARHSQGRLHRTHPLLCTGHREIFPRHLQDPARSAQSICRHGNADPAAADRSSYRRIGSAPWRAREPV